MWNRRKKIVTKINRFISSEKKLKKIRKKKNPYGSGNASKEIIRLLLNEIIKI